MNACSRIVGLRVEINPGPIRIRSMVCDVQFRSSKESYGECVCITKPLYINVIPTVTGTDPGSHTSSVSSVILCMIKLLRWLINKLLYFSLISADFIPSFVSYYIRLVTLIVWHVATHISQWRHGKAAIQLHPRHSPRGGATISSAYRSQKLGLQVSTSFWINSIITTKMISNFNKSTCRCNLVQCFITTSEVEIEFRRFYQKQFIVKNWCTTQ